MTNIIYEKEYLVEYGDGESSYFDSIDCWTDPKEVKKIIEEFCAYSPSLNYLIQENLFKPKEIKFDKIFSELETGKIKFNPGAFTFKISKSLFTSYLFGVDGANEFELTSNTYGLKLYILFFPAKSSDEISDEIHITNPRYGKHEPEKEIWIRNNDVFSAKIIISPSLVSD